MHIDVEWLGFPIRFQGEGRRREWARLLGRCQLPVTTPSERGRTVLTVVFARALPDAAVTNRRARGAGGANHCLAGDGFMLDMRRRRLYYPLSAPHTMVVGAKRVAHNLLARTIVFALALLAENNPDSPYPPLARGGKQRLCSRHGWTTVYLHASAVRGPRGALVFCGRSTFGKTTIAGTLLRAWPQLEDDLAMALVRPETKPRLALFEEGRGGRRTLRIAGLFWLEKARVCRLEPLAAAEAAALLVEPVVSGGQTAIRNRLRALRALVAGMRCLRLRFRKESGPLRALLRRQGYL